MQILRPGADSRNWLLLPAVLVFVGAFVAPLLYFLVISFWSVRARIMRPDFTLKNYIATWTDYYDAMASTLLIALAIGTLTTVLAFGFAYAIRFKCGRFEAPLLFLALITLFGGYLVKIYAWKSILGREGIFNQALTVKSGCSLKLRTLQKLMTSSSPIGASSMMATIASAGARNQASRRTVTARHPECAGRPETSRSSRWRRARSLHDAAHPDRGPTGSRPRAGGRQSSARCQGTRHP